MRHCLALACALFAATAQAQSPLCDNGGQPAPRALLERFISADCAECWTAADTRRTPRGALALDWVLPGEQGDDAPLAAVARREARDRADSLGLRLSSERRQLSNLKQLERGGNARLRVAHGLALGGYMGASLRFQAPRGARGPFTGWLALVELLPAGTEGTPVPRALVRNLIAEPIAARPQGSLGQIWRPMNVPEGAAAERLEVIGWVSDARGRVLAAAQSACGAPSRK